MKYALLTFALMLNLGSAHAAGDAEAGVKLFAKTCGGCHSIGEGARGGFGPDRNGIIGRPAGTTADYPSGLGLRMLVAGLVGLVLLFISHRVFTRLQGNFAQEL